MTTSFLDEALDVSRHQGAASPWRPTVLRPCRSLVFDGAVVLALLVVVGAATGWGLRLYPALNGDEGIYTEQARAVLHGALSPYTYTYDHPFLGWVQLSGLAWVAQQFHLGGALSVINARFVMVALQLVNVVLLYGIARRLDMQRTFAAVAVLLFGLSPLTIDLSRQVYLDNIAMPWLLLAFFLMLNRRRNQWLFALAGSAFAMSVLSKETVVLFAPALLYLLRQRTYRHLRVMAATVAVMMFCAIVIIYPVFALLRGELFPGPGHVSLWTNGIMYQLASRAGSGAVWTAGSAKQQLLQGWLSFDKVLIVGGLIAAVMTAWDRSRRWLTVGALAAVAPVVKPGGYLPAMYVVCLLPFAALAMAAVADRVWRATWSSPRPWLARAFLPTALACGAAVGGIGPAYATGDQAVSTVDLVRPAAQAQAYLVSQTTRSDTVLTDDAFIVDLNRHGLTDPWHQAVSYYKYDLDPTARKQLPGDYRNLTVVVDTPQMRADIRSSGLKYTQDAVAHSRVVATFGSGPSRIEIRRIP